MFKISFCILSRVKNSWKSLSRKRVRVNTRQTEHNICLITSEMPIACLTNPFCSCVFFRTTVFFCRTTITPDFENHFFSPFQPSEKLARYKIRTYRFTDAIIRSFPRTNKYARIQLCTTLAVYEPSNREIAILTRNFPRANFHFREISRSKLTSFVRKISRIGATATIETCTLTQ